MQTLTRRPLGIYNSACAVILCLCLVSSQGCVGRKKKSSESGRKIGSVIGADEVKRRVSPDELNGPTMRLEKFEVSIVDIGEKLMPLLSFKTPEKADFVQIIRCDANLKTSFSEIPDSATQSVVTDSTAAPKANTWNKISSTLGCLQISTGVSTNQYPDYFANSGNWIYLGRACINPARLPNSAVQSEIEPCSRQIFKTSVLSGYVSQQADISVEKQTEIMLLRDRVDELGRNIFYKVRRLKTEILFCEAEKGVNFISLKRRDSSDKILKFGIVLGSSLIDQPPLVPAHPKELISSTLLELEAGSQEFLPNNFCISADQTRQDIESERLQMESDAKVFNQNVAMFGRPSALNSAPSEEKSSR
ncbi:MAG: hypothetical protein RL189_337 [Pseudomonadota bacterium]